MRSTRSPGPELRLIRGGKPDGPTSAEYTRAALFTALMFVPGVMYCVYLEWHSRRYGVDSILSKDFSKDFPFFNRLLQRPTMKT